MWTRYWDMAEHRHIFEVEARDYLARLRAAVSLRPTDHVLDFGCGFGHVVALLAPLVDRVGYWDASMSRRSATAARVRGTPNVEEVDLHGPLSADALGTFDVVVANSVVQYMTRAELSDWLPRWRAMLGPQGRIVLSDIPTPDASVAAELAGVLRFAARHGFLLRALRDGMDEARRYARSRRATELRCWTRDDLIALARNHGLSARVLPVNVTHRAARFTAVLQPRCPAGPVASRSS